MDSGMYAAASAGLLQFRKLDVVNNNLANANTAGFKKQLVIGEVQSFDRTLARLVEQKDPYARGDHARTAGTVNIQTVTDFSPGSIQHTGNTLDVALQNANDFFVINTPEGNQYTRAGNFTLNSESQLVTVDGYTVAGEGAEITTNGPGASIAPDGSVRVNGQEVGRLAVVRFEDPMQLQRVGSARFALPEGAAAPQTIAADLIPQSLEMSNVSAISSIVDLITANRAFGMYTKSAQTIDQMNDTAISKVSGGR